LADGIVDRIGGASATLTVRGAAGKLHMVPLQASNHVAANQELLRWMEAQDFFPSVSAVGHRIVHGMKYSAPVRVTDSVLKELRRITPYAPEHLPREIALIEAFRKRYPKLAQVACFDTAFHHAMPDVAKLLPIPRRFAAKGVRRYGFHGLSYTYLMEELERLDPRAIKGRVILAHLGNGASMAAVKNGKSVDTSMGFTPTAGLVMSTRTGDLDPGLIYYLARTAKMTPSQFQHMVSHESGLLGVSQRSSDMRDLLAAEAKDVQVAEAIELFCYQARKWIGSFAAVMGGLDTLVFAGGVGENAAVIRQRICRDLTFLGIELDRPRNSKHASLISRDSGRVKVRVIRTDEEQVIARLVSKLLKTETVS
jgi:acetate kinase